MKKLIMLLFLASISLFPVKINAQDLNVVQVENSIKKAGKYAMLVRNAEHLKASVKTATGLIKENPQLDFQIVVCGELVKSLVNDNELRQLMDKAKNGGIKILACGLSMDKFNITGKDLPSSVMVTQNGLVYIFGLQKNGYKTITL
ncbi:hypothetical protein GWA97_07690 [Flavobacterium sp. LaA7.5]|nr:hypothetical protein [Flavobacterium salilacus subsp. altitudinum]